MASTNCVLLTLIVLFSVSSFEVTSQGTLDGSDCTTPHGSVGTCTIIWECKTMLDFLKKAINVTSSLLVNNLRDYRCGVEGKFVKVCCPKNPIQVKLPGIPPSSDLQTTPIPPDVSNHRNRNLLPNSDNCGNLPPTDRIINGNKTAPLEYPWMTLLSYQTKSGKAFRCGGTLINDRYVLTAAHCITNNNNNLILVGVRLGEYNISSPQDCRMVGKKIVCADPVQDIEIEDAIPHPNYNFTTYINDIGLLRLKTPAKLTANNVKPICLPVFENQRNRNFVNERLLVTGWGSTGLRSNGSAGSDDLLLVELPVIPEADCKAVYDQTPAVINHKQLCAGGKNQRDSCGGDSGGPLQMVDAIDLDVHFVQYGVVSFGPRNCGLEGYPGVYTRTDYFMDWILNNMGP